MIAAELSVPELLALFGRPQLAPRLAVCATLVELELRASIRCSRPEEKHFWHRTSDYRAAFRLEVLDRGPTGDELLDATLAAVSPLAVLAHERVGVDRVTDAAKPIDLPRRYVDRLVAAGRVHQTGTKGVLRRKPVWGVVNPEPVRALKQDLFTRLLHGKHLHPRDEAVAAFLAIGLADPEKLDVVVKPYLPGSELAELDRKARKQKLRTTRRRATELLRASPVAHALYMSYQIAPRQQ